MKIVVKPTHGLDPDFVKLTRALDEDLLVRYGEPYQEFKEHNQKMKFDYAAVAYADGVPAACGAYRDHGEGTVELKRIYVADSHRRMGLAKAILADVEAAARRAGFVCAILETGVNQPEAISLYKQFGYRVIPNFEPYEQEDLSVCMQKAL